MNDLTLSLEITALGMGLVFGAIILLWIMMVLLTAFTANLKSESDAEPEAESEPDAKLVSPAGSKAQAAAIAVAIALAEQGQSTARPLSQPPTALVSAWQLGMRTSQRSQKGSIGRR